MNDVAYWTDCLVENEAKIAELLNELNGKPEKTINRMDQILLRELLNNNAAYVKFLAEAVAAQLAPPKKRKYWRR